jgi:hypothetical protein
VSAATGWWEAETTAVLVNVDKLDVGAKWRSWFGDLFVKVSPLSHKNLRTGEIVLDQRLYGHDETFYVEVVA